MSGLLRRIRPRRAAADRPTADHPAATTPGEPREDAARALPAGTDPERLYERREVGRRGAARRRLRHLRRVRELLLRDLGGYVYELHRTGAAAQAEPGVLTRKLDRITELDAERAELEARVGDRSGELLLREPGIGGRCATCGELHGSEARFCSACGMPLVAGAARPVPALADADVVEEPAALAPGAAPAGATVAPGSAHRGGPQPVERPGPQPAEHPGPQPAEHAQPQPAEDTAPQPTGAQPSEAQPTEALEPVAEARPADWLPAEEPRR